MTPVDHSYAFIPADDTPVADLGCGDIVPEHLQAKKALDHCLEIILIPICMTPFEITPARQRFQELSVVIPILYVPIDVVQEHLLPHPLLFHVLIHVHQTLGTSSSSPVFHIGSMIYTLYIQRR